MMSFRPTRLSASMCARVGAGATCAAFLMCLAAAQSIPEGYVATREGDVIVMRPSAAADPDVAIRVYPPFAGDGDTAAIAHRWAESHPLAGVNAGAVSLQDKTVNGMSCLIRVWMVSGQPHIELIMMPQAGSGRFRPMVGRMPSQPGPQLTNHIQAMASVAGMIQAGQFQSKTTPDGKGNRSAAMATAESTGNETASARSAPLPAPVRAVPAQTQATTELLARLEAQIETMGFESSYETAIGGGTSYGIAPVALFRNGDARLNIGNLVGAVSVEADRAAHPKDWCRWRRTAGGNELLQDGKWEKLTSPATMARSPHGFVLSGDYSRLIGSGGNDLPMVVAQFRYIFRPDGTFSTNGYGAVTGAGYPVVAHHPVVEGRYRIEGYLLRLEPDRGPPETHWIVIDPKFLDAIWIDGYGYTRPH